MPPSADNTPQQNPYAATSQDLGIHLSGNQELAGRGTRLAAVVVDLLIYFVLSSVISLIVFMSGALLFPNDDSSNTSAAIMFVLSLLLLPTLLFVAIQLYFMARHSQSIGKYLMKIRVMRASTGERCGLGRYFWMRGVVSRLILTIVPFAIVINPLMIFSDSRRCLHDRISDTKVVKA